MFRSNCSLERGSVRSLSVVGRYVAAVDLAVEWRRRGSEGAGYLMCLACEDGSER